VLHHGAHRGRLDVAALQQRQQGRGEPGRRGARHSWRGRAHGGRLSFPHPARITRTPAVGQKILFHCVRTSSILGFTSDAACRRMAGGANTLVTAWTWSASYGRGRLGAAGAPGTNHETLFDRGLKMPDLSSLTERQKEIYHFIREKIESRGYGPTVREIGDGFGIQSPNG